MIPLDADEQTLAKEAARELRRAKDALTRCVLIEISNRKGAPANKPSLQEDVEHKVGKELLGLIPHLAGVWVGLAEVRDGFHDTNVLLRDVK